MLILSKEAGISYSFCFNMDERTISETWNKTRHETRYKLRLLCFNNLGNVERTRICEGI